MTDDGWEVIDGGERVVLVLARTMRLIVIHYHWRMGGVRRVVETGVPALVACDSLRIGEVVFVSGEAADPAWEKQMRAAFENTVPVSFVVEPAFGYVAEWGGSIESLRRDVREAAARVLAGPIKETLVLLENPAVGRNLLLAPAFANACAANGAWLCCHHHDYFFDGRWERWPEINSCGFGATAEAMAAAFPIGDRVFHLAVSARQAAMLRRGPDALEETHVCPNPVVIDDAEPATDWLRQRLGTDAPVWLLPCRLLRRKNVLEAVLLARLFHPEAVVVTTGGPSSAAEQAYAEALARAAAQRGWPLHLGVLADGHPGDPSVAGLMRASEMVVMPSLLEGFGLPLYEAAALGVPALARRDALCGGWLESVETYLEVWIDRTMLDWPAELDRQRALFSRWRERLPRDAAAIIREPWWWHPDAPVPFSRLSVHGQLDLLGIWEKDSDKDADLAHRDLVDLNPWLSQGWGDFGRWRRTTGVNAKWAGCQSPDDFVDGIAGCLKSLKGAEPVAGSGSEAFSPPVLTAERLAQTNHYPLLWSTGT